MSATPQRQLHIYLITNHSAQQQFPQPNFMAKHLLSSVVIAGCPSEARACKDENGKDYIRPTDTLSVHYLGIADDQPHNNSARVVCISRV